MSGFDFASTALAYASRGWRVFPAFSKNRPAVKWKDEAITDEAQIRKWWSRWPHALVGLPTGQAFVALDVDVKTSPTGFDTLERLGFALWFSTPTVNTPSGGSHGYFKVPTPAIRNTNGTRGRGIGPQLDWRGLGGYVIAPSPDSGYSWDPYLGIDTPLAEVPAALLPIEKARDSAPAPRSDGLSRYAEGALDQACRAILAAPEGEQEHTLNAECLSIGSLAGAGGIPQSIALQALLYIASRIPDYDPNRPWRTIEIDAKVRRAFAHGLAHPRKSEVRHG
jgi:hypothetical protein